MRPLTVAHVLPFVTHRANGVAAAVAGLAGQLQRDGVRTEIWNLTHEVTSPGERRWGADDLRVIDLPRARSMLRRALDRRLTPTLDWARAQHTRVDVLHFHGVFQLESQRLARRVGLPYVVSPQGGYNAGALRQKPRSLPQKIALWLLSERDFLERSAALHLVSDDEERGVRALGFQGRAVIVPNAVEVPPAPRHVPDKEAPYFLFLGRMAVYTKGLDRLLQGYAIARQASHALPRLVLAGPDHESGLGTLGRLAASLDIQADVAFVPPVEGESKERLLNGALAYVQLSRHEGLPFSVLEALAAGVPPILTRGTNLAELVRDGEAGWFCGDRPEDVASVLLTAARTPRHMLDATGRRAHALARVKFDWRVIGARFAALYDDVRRGA